MKYRIIASRFWMLLFTFSCLTLCSCGGTTDANPPISSSNDDSPSDITDDPTPSADGGYVETDKVGTRDNTPVVLIGSADGTNTTGNESVTIDISNTSEGYFMVNYTGSNQKPKLRLTGPNQITYTYDLHGGYEAFPLTSGDGSYTLEIFENIEGTSYSTLFTQSIDVSISNEFGPYLYANQYVNFAPDSTVIEKGSELARSADEDLEVVQNVYNYIITNFTYDYDKAATVESGYLPDVDEIYSKQTGICFDYAAVMATMLRTQNIPTRLEVGYMEDVYHAWISTYISGKGWVNGIIEFDGNEWTLMDPTFASASPTPTEFLTETDKYLTKYVY